MIKNPGDTVGVKNTITDEAGALLDPDSHEIKIYDSSGKLQTTITNPTKVSQGVYKFYYTLPDAATVGDWKITWKAVKGTYVEREHWWFEVKLL